MTIENQTTSRTDVTATIQSQIRIAIADDHAIFRDALCRLLSIETDLSVVAHAEDGLRALEILRQHQPDILLLDLSMPRQGGLATLEALQSIDIKTRVILLTASDNESEFVQALTLEALTVSLESKPMRIYDLWHQACVFGRGLDGSKHSCCPDETLRIT